MKLKSFFASCCILTAFICLPSFLQAAPGDPGRDPDPTKVPFDGGLSLVIAAGAAYASKKAFDKRKKEKIVRDSEK